MHERFLDYDDVAQVLAQMGFVDAQKRPFTADRIRGWANRRALPFFLGPDRKRRISESALMKAIKEMQNNIMKPRNRPRRRYPDL